MNTTRAKRSSIRWLLVAATAVWTLVEYAPVGIAQTAPAPDPATMVAAPADARQLGFESLRTAIANSGGVPLPPNIGDFIADKQAAIRLGKALFWDMQVGSDGVQACGSERVRLEQAPFDHPEIFIPVTGLAEGGTLTSQNFKRVPQDGQAGISASNVQPHFLNLDPRDPVFTPSGVCSIDP